VSKQNQKPVYGLEELFFSHRVDMYICGHEHIYERQWPVHDNKILNGSVSSPYTNPKAPVYIVTGSAGCRERNSKIVPNPPAFNAFSNNDYGYTRMQIFNASHLYLEQVSDDKVKSLRYP
jgi:acid phosphatase type 7